MGILVYLPMNAYCVAYNKNERDNNILCNKWEKYAIKDECPSPKGEA